MNRSSLRYWIAVLLISACSALGYAQNRSGKIPTLPAYHPPKFLNGDTCSAGFPKNWDTHFASYYSGNINGHVCDNFDRKQIDFSDLYYHLQTLDYKDSYNDIAAIEKQDCSAIFLTSQDYDLNGIFDTDFYRIRFHIDAVQKDNLNPRLYHIKGKSRLKNNILPLGGTMTLISAFRNVDTEDTLENIYFEYFFKEDSLVSSSGFYKGKGDCFTAFKDNNKLAPAASFDYGITFVGTWTSHRTSKVKKCIWGDGFLPFPFDFNCGAGELHPCDKYANNGWQGYNDEAKWEVNGDAVRLKDRWWLLK